MSRALAAALAKLLDSEGGLAASTFTSAQRRALEELARKTGALSVRSEGRGITYQTVNADLLAAHLQTLRPQRADALDPNLPKRAANIATARDSKAGAASHAVYYLLVKAIGAGVCWQREPTRAFDLAEATQIAGAGVLAITEDDAWRSEQALWLVENQALFDHLDWLPPEAQGTVAYYAGQLPNRLLHWLAAQQRASEVVLFPDYDGVGLLNYARLREACAGPCAFWLMPAWQARLSAFGSRQVWQNTQTEFHAALARLEALGLDAGLAELCAALRNAGLALEHESIWLAVP